MAKTSMNKLSMIVSKLFKKLSMNNFLRSEAGKVLPTVGFYIVGVVGIICFIAWIFLFP
ncbi:MAG TPA: hypothetical protein VNJ01_01025 [Bacteriovoracaceae bacterium]|nr:hypothetical protein [Bacteriovoracaceae bacterium]